MTRLPARQGSNRHAVDTLAALRRQSATPTGAKVSPDWSGRGTQRVQIVAKEVRRLPTGGALPLSDTANLLPPSPMPVPFPITDPCALHCTSKAIVRRLEAERAIHSSASPCAQARGYPFGLGRRKDGSPRAVPTARASGRGVRLTCVPTGGPHRTPKSTRPGHHPWRKGRGSEP